jgi:hypothetical protein
LTKQELILKGNSSVRANHSLLLSYIELFKSEFGYIPQVPCCGNMHEWEKFKNSNNLKKNTKMESVEKTFKVKDIHKIFSYVKKEIREYCRGSVLTEEFVKDYLSYGNEEELELRKSEFYVLPKTEKTETEKLSFKDLKELYPEFSEAKNKKEILELIEKSETEKAE